MAQIKRRLTAMTLGKIAAVDRPCQEHATMTIVKRADDGDGPDAEDAADEAADAEADAYLKRAFTADERQALAGSGAAMKDGAFPISSKADLKNAVRAFGRAKNKAATKKHIIARAGKLDATDLLPDGWVAKAIDDEPDGPDDEAAETELQKGLQAALEAAGLALASVFDTGSQVDKAALLSETLNAFTTHAQGLVSGSVQKTTGAHEAGTQMTTETIKKSLGLPATATDADVEKALTEQTAAFAKAQADLAIAKMSDKHKAFADAKGMTGDKLAAFAGKTADERDAHMAENPIAKSADALEIEKRDTVIAKMAADLEVLNKRAEISEIAKRLNDASDGKYIGKAEDDAALIYDLGKSDKTAAEAMEKRLTGLSLQVVKGGLLTEIGSAAAGISKAADGIETAAKALMAATPGMSIQKARTLARAQNAELAKQEHAEAEAARTSRRA